MSYAFRLSTAGVTALKAVRTNWQFADWRLSVARANTELILSVHRTPVTTLSERAGRRQLAELPVIRELRAQGVHDSIGVFGVEPDGWGIGVVGLLRSVQRVTPGARALWQRIAGHLQAAHRLRRRLGVAAWGNATIAGSTGETRDRRRIRWSIDFQEPPSHSSAPAQAVVDPSGRVIDATDDARDATAREALRRAAIAVDRARARMLRGGADGETLAEWHALVEGRWSLLDRFESDGRRFLVARRNSPGTTPTPLLDEHERAVLGYRAAGHPLKLIAYEMGFSVPWASRTLKSAMDKLGLRSPAELARFGKAREP
jgi:DNA-binding NarL/FixJ family response regulator